MEENCIYRKNIAYQIAKFNRILKSEATLSFEISVCPYQENGDERKFYGCYNQNRQLKPLKDFLYQRASNMKFIWSIDLHSFYKN